jgi:DNA-binding GntR family transcriptional regulator
MLFAWRRLLTQHKESRAKAPDGKPDPEWSVGGPGVRTMSLADAAYERIKLGIISLHFRAGAYVNEAQLCADLEFGRTSVHDAVIRLALEGIHLPERSRFSQGIRRRPLGSVLRALQAHDPARAEAAMCAHIESFRAHVRASI